MKNTAVLGLAEKLVIKRLGPEIWLENLIFRLTICDKISSTAFDVTPHLMPIVKTVIQYCSYYQESFSLTKRLFIIVITMSQHIFEVISYHAGRICNGIAVCQC